MTDAGLIWRLRNAQWTGADLDAAASRLEALTAGGWQPIETAPKDGTWVDTWGVPDNGAPPGRWADVYWRDGFWRMPSIMSDGRAGPEIRCPMSHWRPLPLPPPTRR